MCINCELDVFECNALTTRHGFLSCDAFKISLVFCLEWCINCSCQTTIISVFFQLAPSLLCAAYFCSVIEYWYLPDVVYILLFYNSGPNWNKCCPFHYRFNSISPWLLMYAHSYAFFWHFWLYQTFLSLYEHLYAALLLYSLPKAGHNKSVKFITYANPWIQPCKKQKNGNEATNQ